LNPDEWKLLLSQVDRAIEDAARAQSLAGAPTKHSGSGAQERVSELFDPERYIISEASYELPTYKGGRTKAGVKADDNPFEHLLELYDSALDSSNALFDAANGVGDQTNLRREIRHTHCVADLHAAGEVHGSE
jgi:hypothetical protein